ncbi:MAG: patatin-like phospholipase family protein [Spartobacteria bacterium]
MKIFGRAVGISLAILLVVAVGLALWLHDKPPRYNEPLVPTSATSPPTPVDNPLLRGMWPDNTEQDDATLMLMSISGGGSRAAAVGWKTLDVLRRSAYRFTNANGTVVDSNLANEIDLVAGISGGSFAATAWCLKGSVTPAFQQRFVERDIQAELKRRFFSGKGILAAFSTRYARINFAAELYDEDIFERKTFADLPSRPILRLHATNLALGQRFTFTRDTFERLGSNLLPYPLGYACAASSAFPILLDPLTLRNYPPSLDLEQDRSYQSGKKNARADLNVDLRNKAWEFFNNKTNEYVHLADGGLVDNQGLQSILDEFDNNGVINRRINFSAAPLQRLIIVNVNAGVAKPDASSHSPEAPDVASVVESTMVSSMDVLSARRWMDILAQTRLLYKGRIDRPDAPAYSQLEEPYRIEISFRNIGDAELRRQAMALPTSFKLTAEQLALIDKVVPELLQEDPEFQRLQAVLSNR